MDNFRGGFFVLTSKIRKLMRVYAIDFETYYDKEVSITKLGWKSYFNHPLFDPYMVTVFAESDEDHEEYRYVGDPKKLDWGFLEGNMAISHNASFDELLYYEGLDNGWWCGPRPVEWNCTADLSAYCGFRRSLKDAMKDVFDKDISKDTRDNMKNLRWEDMTPEFRAEVEEYALDDSILCLELWNKLSCDWPDFERNISQTNRTVMRNGIYTNLEYLKKCKETLTSKIFDIESSIPWAKDKPILSRKAYNEKCRELGIEPPASLSLDNPDSVEWIRREGSKYAWIKSVSEWRRVNTLRSKLESICNACNKDSRCYIGMTYFGAHTGRFSGSGGSFNIQNLPRKEMFGVDIRKMFSAPEGKTMVVVDLSQIEVRTLAYLTGDRDLLDDIRDSDDIYETFAIRFGLWDSSKGQLRTDPALRHKVKTIVLGCGYGAGGKKFSDFSGMSVHEAFEAVNIYRSAMRPVTSLWKKYDNSLYTAFTEVGSKRNWALKLPSGRSINYSNISYSVSENGNRSCVVTRNYGKTRSKARIWGGVVAENASQALARDIFCDSMLRLVNAGFKILFHVHDEVVLEVEQDQAEYVLEKTVEIMSTPPEWIKDIPLEAEGSIMPFYSK